MKEISLTETLVYRQLQRQQYLSFAKINTTLLKNCRRFSLGEIFNKTAGVYHGYQSGFKKRKI